MTLPQRAIGEFLTSATLIFCSGDLLPSPSLGNLEIQREQAFLLLYFCTSLVFYLMVVYILSMSDSQRLRIAASKRSTKSQMLELSALESRTHGNVGTPLTEQTILI